MVTYQVIEETLEILGNWKLYYVWDLCVSKSGGRSETALPCSGCVPPPGRGGTVYRDVQQTGAGYQPPARCDCRYPVVRI